MGPRPTDPAPAPGALSPDAEAAAQGRADHARLKQLFEAVCDLPDSAAQRARLQALAVGDAMCERVMSLLAAQKTGGAAPLRPLTALRSLVARGGPSDTDDSAPELAPGDQLGAWTLRSELGRGGMGRVYLAERSDGHYQQRAAIKLLLGWSGPQALAQLTRERQILASLTHPHIARLLDGGTTPRGRPYLVMEYVDGQRIDLYCRERQLDLDARLRLFGMVCEAVAYAHRQLVVHCDIKPGNVLVDAEGRAMLLDFGIARLQDQEDAVASGLTPRYASPEQRAGLPATASSDIYSLGRMLDELLRPLPKPVRQREWQAIVARATAEQPGQRYLSVGAMQNELRRFQQHLPLAALPRRWRYVTGKFLRRRWPWVLVAAGALSMSIGFTLRVVLERDRALLAEATARQEAATTRQVSDLLVGLFEGADPSVSGRPDLSAATLVDRGRERVDSGLADRPELRASMQAVLGRVYENMGRPRPALELYEQAIAAEHRLGRSAREAALLGRMAMALSNNGQSARGLVLARRSLALRESAGATPLELAEAHDTLGHLLSRNGAFDEAGRHLEQALRSRRELLGARHADTAVTLHHLGMLRASQGQLDAAEASFAEAWDIKHKLLGDSHPSTLNTLQTRASNLAQLQRLDEAEALLRELLRLRRALLGPSSAPVATALNELASVLQDAGRPREAVALYQESLAINEALSGHRATPVAVNLNNLATALEDSGDAGAEALYRESLAIRQGLLPAQDLSVARAQHNLGRWLLRQGRAAEAEPLIEAAWSSRRAGLPAGHNDLLDSELTAAELALGAGRIETAAGLIERVAEQEGAMRAPRRIALLRAQGLLARAQGHAALASERHRAAVELAGKTWPRRHGAQLRLQLELAQAQWDSGQHDAARRGLSALLPAAHALREGAPLRRQADALALASRDKP